MSARPGQRSLELTGRERQILKMISEGKMSKEMAPILGISVKTIEKHRGNLMRKTGIHNIASLTRYAIQNGLG